MVCLMCGVKFDYVLGCGFVCVFVDLFCVW